MDPPLYFNGIRETQVSRWINKMTDEPAGKPGAFIACIAE
jgi:hypothetical protein